MSLWVHGCLESKINQALIVDVIRETIRTKTGWIIQEGSRKTASRSKICSCFWKHSLKWRYSGDLENHCILHRTSSDCCKNQRHAHNGIYHRSFQLHPSDFYIWTKISCSSLGSGKPAFEHLRTSESLKAIFHFYKQPSQ